MGATQIWSLNILGVKQTLDLHHLQEIPPSPKGAETLNTTAASTQHEVEGPGGMRGPCMHDPGNSDYDDSHRRVTRHR
jgi:hypothetical protein